MPYALCGALKHVYLDMVRVHIKLHMGILFFKDFFVSVNLLARDKINLGALTF